MITKVSDDDTRTTAEIVWVPAGEIERFRDINITSVWGSGAGYNLDPWYEIELFAKKLIAEKKINTPDLMNLIRGAM